MTTRNQFIPTTISRSYASDRGSPQSSRSEGASSASFSPANFLLMPDQAIAATVALHEAMARNWSCCNLFYKEVYWIVRPFYFFPLEMAQHYYRLMFGLPQCLSEPMVKQRKTEGLERAEQYVQDGALREEIEQATDIATGACTEMWFEIVEDEEEARVMVA
jgi:hypothetical protein